VGGGPAASTLSGASIKVRPLCVDVVGVGIEGWDP
jgi:hypothetical protein